MHIIRAMTHDQIPLQAAFDPEKGMNLTSFLWGGIELFDPLTRSDFDRRFAGFGALIGPHFYHRKDGDIPAIDVRALFPFTTEILKKQKEPFSHGIARYVPWKFEGNSHQIEAHLHGNDIYKGVRLLELEGQDFELIFKANLKADGLHIEYSMACDKPSVIGLHYYYTLPNKRGLIRAKVNSEYHHPEGWKQIPKNWKQSESELCFKIDETVEADFGFRPIEGKSGALIQLLSDKYVLSVDYQTSHLENAWQLYHPKKASYVCIEPVSAKNPREATLMSAKINVLIRIDQF